MATKKTQATKKQGASAAASAAGSGSVRVLVELKVSRTAGPEAALSLGAPSFESAGFAVDEGFGAVPLGTPPEAAATLEAEHEERVLVRGSIAEDQMAELEQQEHIEGVWLDTRIAAFPAGDPAGEEQRPFVDTVESAAFGTCPIPPCDCSPSVAKGDFAAVRRYLGVDQIWAAGHRGSGIVVGVVDGGITTPARVAGGRVPKVVGGPKSDWGQKAFWGRHGEMTGSDVLAMAPDARLYDIRLPDATIGDPLSAQISDAIAGYHWAINRHRADGTPHVLTNSWGIYQKAWDPVYACDAAHPFTRKVVEAVNEGILVLFAAGNCGQACPDGRCGGDVGEGKSIWGANGHPRVMTVGAANIQEQLIGYSSQGPACLDPHKPDFCGISHFKGYFAVDTGTSAACPIVAGVVALLKQAKSGLTQDAAKQALKRTAKNLGTAGWDRASGSGIIQAKRAYDLIRPTRPCQRELANARRYYTLYRRTRRRIYLCYYYYWAALYFRCLYLRTRNRRYLCAFYLWAARYLLCLYRATGNRRYYDLYRRYLTAYRRCR